jgi:hypothetical protein
MSITIDWKDVLNGIETGSLKQFPGSTIWVDLTKGTIQESGLITDYPIWLNLQNESTRVAYGVVFSDGHHYYYNENGDEGGEVIFEPWEEREEY